MLRFLLLFALLLSFHGHAQIDQKKLDSLSRFIDSSAKARRTSQDSIIRFQDSTFHSEVNKALHQKATDSTQFITEQKRKEAEQRQKITVRIIIGVLLLVLLMAVARRRKTKT